MEQVQYGTVPLEFGESMLAFLDQPFGSIFFGVGTPFCRGF